MAVCQAIVEMWASFVAEFRELWTASVKRGEPGDLCPTALFGIEAPAGPASLEVNLHASASFCLHVQVSVRADCQHVDSCGFMLCK